MVGHGEVGCPMTTKNAQLLGWTDEQVTKLTNLLRNHGVVCSAITIPKKGTNLHIHSVRVRLGALVQTFEFYRFEDAERLVDALDHVAGFEPKLRRMA